MKKKLSIVAFMAIALIGIILILSGFGMFTNIEFSQKKVGPYTLAYDSWTGDYKLTGMVMKRVAATLHNKYDVRCSQTFGLYFDNPEKVTAEKRRSIGGCIIENSKAEALSDMNTKYDVHSFPETRSAVTVFPFAGSLSVMLGVLRVYPKLRTYIQKHQLPSNPVMEIYDGKKGVIQYVYPIDASSNSLEKLFNPQK